MMDVTDIEVEIPGERFLILIVFILVGKYSSNLHLIQRGCLNLNIVMIVDKYLSELDSYLKEVHITIIF